MGYIPLGVAGLAAKQNYVASPSQKIHPFAIFLFTICIIIGIVGLLIIVGPEGEDAKALPGLGWFFGWMILGFIFMFCLKVADQWDRVAVLRFGKFCGIDDDVAIKRDRQTRHEESANNQPDGRFQKEGRDQGIQWADQWIGQHRLIGGDGLLCLAGDAAGHAEAEDAGQNEQECVVTEGNLGLRRRMDQQEDADIGGGLDQNPDETQTAFPEARHSAANHKGGNYPSVLSKGITKGPVGEQSHSLLFLRRHQIA